LFNRDFSPFIATLRCGRGSSNACVVDERKSGDGEDVATFRRISGFAEGRPQLCELRGFPTAFGLQIGRWRHFTERLVQDLGQEARLTPQNDPLVSDRCVAWSESTHC
jgi:hypothetical protein